MTHYLPTITPLIIKILFFCWSFFLSTYEIIFIIPFDTSLEAPRILESIIQHLNIKHLLCIARIICDILFSQNVYCSSYWIESLKWTILFITSEIYRKNIFMFNYSSNKLYSCYFMWQKLGEVLYLLKCSYSSSHTKKQSWFWEGFLFSSLLIPPEYKNSVIYAQFGQSNSGVLSLESILLLLYLDSKPVLYTLKEGELWVHPQNMLLSFTSRATLTSYSVFHFSLQ